MACPCPTSLRDTVPLDDFLPYIQPQAPNAPAEMCAHYIRLAAIQLCREAQILKETVYADLQEGVQDYCIEIEQCDLQVIAVRRVCAGTIPLAALRDMPCDGEYVGHSYFYEAPSDLLIWPAPSCDIERGLRIDVTLVPGQDACELPRVLYDLWAEALGDGAASRLLLVKGSDWYDPQAAGINLKRFMNAKRDAKVRASRNNVSGPIHMRSRRWV